MAHALRCLGQDCSTVECKEFARHWIDPDYLPEITGTVDQFLVNKHGEADGFLLTDGGEVHVPPHLSSRLLRDVRPGSQVSLGPG